MCHVCHAQLASNDESDSGSGSVSCQEDAEATVRCAREAMKLASVQPLTEIPTDPEAFRDCMLTRIGAA